MHDRTPGSVCEPPHAESPLKAWATSATPAYCRDLDGRVLSANVAFTRKFGRGLSIPAHDSVEALVHPEDIGTFRSSADELQAPPHQVARCHRWLTPQGWRWMSWEESVLFDGSGEAVSVRAVGHDITRQRLAEELYVKLSRAVEQCPVAIVITDADGRAQYVNPKFAEVSGCTLEESIDKETRVLREGHADEESYRKFMEKVRSGAEWQGELARDRPDGTKVWESVQVSSIRNAAGEVTNLLCLREDITQRKRLEEELRQSQKMESLGTLAGGIAHDFNNLLAIINGYAELSSLNPDNVTLHQKSLREIKRASQRAIGLVRQILTFSRKADVRFAPLEITQVVRDLVALLSETFPRKVAFNLALAEGLPPLLADSNQLQQVVLNLCVNARDAMPGGGTITVSTSLVDGKSLGFKEAVRDQNYVRLMVGDTGTGMPPEVKARIFEPFFTTKAGNDGTGLGLAVVYGIIASHHGFIDVETAPGAGSTFNIYLPVGGEYSVQSAPSELSIFPAGTETLLIVDDEDCVRHILRTAFTGKGYRVVSASNGLEAIEILGDPSHAIDAVMLDMNMPRASGLDVLRCIREQRPGLPVLVISGHIDASTRNLLENLGHTDCILKPFQLDDLGRRIRSMLGERPAAPALP